MCCVFEGTCMTDVLCVFEGTRPEGVAGDAVCHP